ncbi:MAG: C1 family peptidase [Ignavibacteria bacterium]
MKKITVLLFVLTVLFTVSSFAQELTTLKLIPSSGVKDQGMSGTCWCFSVISLLESDMMKRGIENPDLSEMYIVRNIYFDKAKNYILRQGFTKFSEGAFGHDVFPAAAKYGFVPESVYPELIKRENKSRGF